jgi:hypothetical protein
MPRVEFMPSDGSSPTVIVSGRVTLRLLDEPRTLHVEANDRDSLGGVELGVCGEVRVAQGPGRGVLILHSAAVAVEKSDLTGGRCRVRFELDPMLSPATPASSG